MSTPKKAIFSLIVFIVVFKLGYQAKSMQLFPISQWIERDYGRYPDSNHKNPAVFNNTSYKKEVGCPKSEDVVIIVGFGQSNSANSAGNRSSIKNENVLNYFDGKCYVAKDPLLGASGYAGSIWIPIGNEISQSVNKKVLLVTFGIDGTSIHRWADDNDLGDFLFRNLMSLKKLYPTVNYFVWVQGEANIGDDPKKYEESLRKVINKTKTLFPPAVFAISSSTYCRGVSDKQIALVQKQVAEEGASVIWLGSTDIYDDWKYRFDDCHFSKEGVAAVAELFAKRLKFAR